MKTTIILCSMALNALFFIKILKDNNKVSHDYKLEVSQENCTIYNLENDVVSVCPLDSIQVEILKDNL